MKTEIETIEEKIKQLIATKKHLMRTLMLWKPLDKNWQQQIDFCNKEIKNLNQKLAAIKINDYPKEINPFENENNIETEETPSNQYSVNERTHLLNHDDIHNINSEQNIEMQYGNKCCPSCVIL